MKVVLGLTCQQMEEFSATGLLAPATDLAPHCRVLLWCDHRLYGVYRVYDRSPGGMILRKGSGRSVHRYQPPGALGLRPEGALLWAAFREGNRKWPQASLAFGQQGALQTVTWAPDGEPQAIHHHALCGQAPQTTGGLYDALQGQTDPMASRDRARQAGRELARELFGPQAPGNGHRVIYHGPHGFMPQAIYQGGFWAAKHRLVRAQKTAPPVDEGLLPRRGVALVLGAGADGGMAEEWARLGRFFHSTPMGVETLRGQLREGALAQVLESCRLFHFCGHGPHGRPGAGLQLGGSRQLRAGNILELARTPEFVFLSCCGDVDGAFAKAWFARGTRALVFPRGVLRSSSMGDLSLTFYSHWRNQAQGLDGALLQARRRWGRLDWNGLLLELMGDHRMPFEEKRGGEKKFRLRDRRPALADPGARPEVLVQRPYRLQPRP